MPTISVILDGEDITDELTIIGETRAITVTVSGEDVFDPWVDTHIMVIVAQDIAGNEVRKIISFTVGYTQVKLILKPEALNINPGILTAYVKFPEPFGVPTIIEATLDGAEPEKWMVSYEDMPDEGLEAPIVVMKFRREEIEKALAEIGEAIDTEFVLKGKFDVYGQLYDFEGQDFVTKIITETVPSEKSKRKK